MIGENLLESTVINPLTNRLLGVDQINIYCKEGALNSQERSRFATSNAMGAKIAIRASNFAKCEISQAIYISPLSVLPSELETPSKKNFKRTHYPLFCSSSTIRRYGDTIARNAEVGDAIFVVSRSV